ncbi:MAG: hypothetical protein E5V72_02010 [Mesorhizobium sp.]|uniref:hypothetical protein n=1 Tax=Mesorhizobium sp. TaxID=1871066 RepID=UPI000FE5C50F|nr:hypothetical protein [Mesorhizobium sp.]RWH49571.1 MAG: hypothetical protein EOQ80_06600 [Mesorhizobium sp.]RWH52190.1 MAG: hypothetical protein EOQ82_27300 [Mesorhizobium sp.]RWI63442.1 MAG: hypothetical protein EOR18_31605 [Mesorhizobium sp.]RWI74823.1 MAG: hypothetical protein EOR19_20275 [Mesorhizobium sp.]RWJ33316.1 MAG: hypothetical protein EOR28_12070 [Mesorhizobium sp.]
MKIVYARGDDWEGLYIDGELETQGHSISLSELLDIIKEKGVIETAETRMVDLNWLGDHGTLPNNIEEVRWEQ